MKNMQQHSELEESDDNVTYERGTATGTMVVGGDSYFDNNTILSQFERLSNLSRSSESTRIINSSV